MIAKQEILNYAKQINLGANTVEKDYILSWLLAGIFANESLKNKWIFKGGTCLKKCYFEEYRFSEDLDFTVIDKSHLDKDYLMQIFAEVSAWVYEQSGIEFPIDKLKFEEYLNPRQQLSITGTIAYKGPMQRQSNDPTVKLDLTNDERIVCDAVTKAIYHPYSDLQADHFFTECYSIEEIFAEKLRALVERFRPRDLYDVIHLHIEQSGKINKKLLLSVLTQKKHLKKMLATKNGLKTEANKNMSLLSSLPKPIIQMIGQFFEQALINYYKLLC